MDRECPVTVDPARVPGGQGFGTDPWWLVIIKAVAIFVFLVVMTLFTIYAERRVVAACSIGSAPTASGRSGCCKAWPTASSWR